MCIKKNASNYINPIGGLDLYSKEEFANKGVHLNFLKTGDVIYKQFDNNFIPYLSIIDLMMFNSKEKLNSYINNAYSII